MNPEHVAIYAEISLVRKAEKGIINIALFGFSIMQLYLQKLGL